MNQHPKTPLLSRRALLAGTAAVGLGTVAATAGAWLAGDREPQPLALVYRGPASCAGCSEAVAHLLRTNPTPFDTEFCGPDEDVGLTAAALSGASVYAQPGGGAVRPAWAKLRGHSGDIRRFVADGGVYLGFCLGAYLASDDPGFGLLPGHASRYIDTDGATVGSADDTIVPVQWRGERRHMFFQDGPTFTIKQGTDAVVLARYTNGQPAALVASYGQGRVGVVGPHPEAARSWYTESGLKNPDGINSDLGHDLIQAAIEGSARTLVPVP